MSTMNNLLGLPNVEGSDFNTANALEQRVERNEKALESLIPHMRTLDAQLRIYTTCEALQIENNELRKQMEINRAAYDKELVKKEQENGQLRSNQQSMMDRYQALQQSANDLSFDNHRLTSELESCRTAAERSKSKGSKKEQLEAMYRAEMDKKNEEIQRMKSSYERRIAEQTRASKASEKRIGELVKETLELKQIIQGEFTGDIDESNTSCSQLCKEYKALHTTKRQGAKKDLLKIDGSDQCNQTAFGRIFYVVFGECKTAVLHGLFQELYQPHAYKDAKDTKAAKLQARVYSQLLQSQSLHCDPNQILHKAEGCFPDLSKLRMLAKEHNATKFEDFLKESVELAWKMVTISPPMIVDWQPQEYDDRLHEKAHEYWSADPNFELVYHRPMLYNSYTDCFPAIKARVGNRPITT